MYLRSLTILLFLIISCQKNSQIVNYPSTKKIATVDTYFNSQVIDNYRWLEDDNAEDTKNWVDKQNETTFSYLKNIPFRGQIKNRLEELWDYERVTAPFKEGDYTYYYKNTGLQNQYVIYREKEGFEAEIFLDPNTFSEDGTTSLSGLNFSKNGQIAAYSISEGGSDWRKIIVMDVADKKIIEDTLVDIKFSGIQWKLNEGFFYSSYDKPDGSELSQMTDQHKLYYHKLGSSQSEDVLIYGGSLDQKHRYVGGSVTDDGNYLFISASKTTSGNISYLKDLSRSNSPLLRVDNNYNTDSYLLTEEGIKFSKNNIKKIKSFDQGKIRIAVSKEIFDNTKARLQSSIAYKKVLENKINEISSREFNDFFRLNDYMKKNQKNEKIQKIKNLFISDKEFKKIIDLIAETQNGGKNNV